MDLALIKLFRFMVLCSLMLVLQFSCAAQLDPFPNEERVYLLLSTEDQTGTHADSLFLTALEVALQSEYIYSGREYRGSGELSKFQIARNPFLAGKSTIRHTISAHGILERVNYGQHHSNQNAMESYFWFGIWPEHLGIDTNDYILGLQYRFRIAEHSENDIIIKAANFADVRTTSRDEMERLASTEVAQEFLFQLAEILMEAKVLTLDTFSRSVHNQKEVEHWIRKVISDNAE